MRKGENRPEMSDVINNQIYEVKLKVEETVDDFIFQTIQPFCESIVKRNISKKELENMLLIAERMKWIPCNKRLPENGKEVLACDKYGEMLIGWIREDSETGFAAESDDTTMYDCVAWMPLPESYEVKKWIEKK